MKVTNNNPETNTNNNPGVIIGISNGNSLNYGFSHQTGYKYYYGIGTSGTGLSKTYENDFSYYGYPFNSLAIGSIRDFSYGDELDVILDLEEREVSFVLNRKGNQVIKFGNIQIATNIKYRLAVSLDHQSNAVSVTLLDFQQDFV